MILTDGGLEVNGAIYPYHPSTFEPWTLETAEEFLAQVQLPPAAEQVAIIEPVRVSKARFGDLFTTAEHRAMNLIRWQITQLTLDDRVNAANPLPDVEVLFQKFDLPAEFIELDNALTVQGISVLGMLGIFGGNAVTRIEAILSNTLPEG
jgi:hypothetical protein